MIYTGKLQCINKNDGLHYGMFCKGNYFDFADNFNCQLTEKIQFRISNNSNYFKQIGRIRRKKNTDGNYAYFINKENIDKVFNKFCGQVVEVEMKNMEE